MVYGKKICGAVTRRTVCNYRNRILDTASSNFLPVPQGRFCIQNAIPINIYSFELTNSYISELSYEVWRAIYTIIQNYFHVQPSISLGVSHHTWDGCTLKSYRKKPKRFIYNTLFIFSLFSSLPVFISLEMVEIAEDMTYPPGDPGSTRIVI